MGGGGGGGVVFFFFFKQKTAYEIVSRDWSSDVCSSDLERRGDAYLTQQTTDGGYVTQSVNVVQGVETQPAAATIIRCVIIFS